MSKDTAFNGETPLRHPFFVTTCNVCPWRSQILHLLENHSLGCVLLCYVLIYNPEVLLIYCVVPENINTPPFPPRKATEILRVGGPKGGKF